MPTLTNTQGALVAGCTANDTISISVVSGAYSLECPIGTALATASTNSGAYALVPGQFRLTTSGSVNYTVGAAVDTGSVPVTYDPSSGGFYAGATSVLTSSLAIRRPWRIVPFGDSRASCAGLSTLLTLVGSTVGLTHTRACTWLAAKLGDAEVVANYGHGGDTAANWDSASRPNNKLIRNLVNGSYFKGGPVDAVYVQYGINDLIGGASAATVTANLKACVGALLGAGYKVIYEATNPASAANYGASAAAKLQATIDTNAAMKAWLATFPGQAVFVDTFPLLVDGTGYASTTYFADGTHFNIAGAKLAGEMCAAAARALLPARPALSYTSGSLLQPNLIDWGSPVMYTLQDQGTVTFTTPTWNVDAATGMPYAEVTATCVALNAGRALGHLEISASAAATGTPRFTLSVGDELQGSAYVTIDDGSGGVAPIQAALLRCYAIYDSKYTDNGGFIGSASTTLNTPIAHRFTTPTYYIATGSGAIANGNFQGLQLHQYVEFNTVGQVARIRLYAPSIRVVSTGLQPSQPSAGASPFTYTNISGSPVMLYVAGGTVSAITLARQGTALTTGATAGQFYLAQNDALTITYTVAPTLTVQPVEQR